MGPGAEAERIISAFLIPSMLSSLKIRTIRNVSYIGTSQLIALLLSLGTMIVLARILTPDDFGIVGIGMVLLNLFYNLQDFGVLPAVIQKDDRIEESISVGLTLRLIIAGIITLVIVGVSPFLSDFFGNPAVAPVLMVYTLNLFVLAVGFPSQAILTRSLRFSNLAVASVVQYIVLAIVAIVLALSGFSYWSLVFGSISASVAYVVSLKLYERAPYGPKLNRRLMGELLGFGKHLLIAGLMVFVIFNVDQIVIARVMGMATLGMYFIAVRFGRSVGEQISTVVNRVLFPTMARIKEDLERLKTGYVQSLRMISIVAVPLTMGMSAVSPVFVEVILGPEWLPAAIPLSILSFQGLLNSLICPASNVLISIGKPWYMSAQSTVQAVAMVIGIYPVATLFGVAGVCLFTTSLSIGVFIYFLLIFSWNLKTSFVEMARPIFPSVLSGVIMYAVVVSFVSVLPTNLVALSVLAAIGFAVYLAALYVFSRGRDVRDVVDLLRTSVGRVHVL